MPRVRYGPDITDDAQSILLDESRVKNKLKGAKSERERTKLLKERDLINQAIKEVFGSRDNARKLAAESVARQGYLKPEDVKALGAKRFKKLKGKGELGLPKTPGRRSEKIGLKKGFQARPETANGDLYRAATAKAKQSEIMRRVRSQQTAAQTSKNKAKTAAKKVGAAKKATPAKKAAAKKAPAKKAAAKKAPAKKSPAKKAAPKKKR
jgi:hypothetical protein